MNKLENKVLNIFILNSGAENIFKNHIFFKFLDDIKMLYNFVS